jgi:hypothetical protein
MGATRILCILLLAASVPVGSYFAAMSVPQVRACFQASYDAESAVSKSRADFVIQDLVDVRDQPQFVDVLRQWREDFKGLEQRMIERTDAACAPLRLNQAMAAFVASVLLAVVVPGGGLLASAWLQVTCASAAGVAALMLQQHRVHLAFVAIIDDLRHTMSYHILPLTNQDDHYLYSLIYASTALRKSEDTPHVTRPALQLPGVAASYDLAPLHAGVCCALFALLAFWSVVTRYLDSGVFAKGKAEGR